MITTLVYRDGRLAAHNPAVESLAGLRAEPSVMLWVDLSAPTDGEIKRILETLFAFHPLAIEDCVSDSPLPKFEEYDDYLYLVMHAVDYTRLEKFTTTELDFFLGKNFLVTFHRQPLKSVQAALDRCLKPPAPSLRGPDRLAHTLLDFMVEHYQPALDELRHDLEKIEDAVLHSAPAGDLFHRVVELRKELATLRQITRPQREVVAALAQGPNRFFRPTLQPYLRDLRTDLTRIEEQANAWAEQLILTFRIFLNKSSHGANEGIRVLTALTAITLPLLVIGAWYGMNFAQMRELRAHYGYPIVIAATFFSTVGILLYLRRRKWL